MADGINYFTSNNNNAGNIIRPSQSGKLNTKLLINEETTAVKLNKNATLLETFTKDLVLKGSTIPLLEIEPTILS